ncbi:MAG: hypothetical protein DHS20C11_19220 [Lysobacteraceae bacterium]|nr:MAG: hypothetical protein DHS20C11_19220 [Xanthomonadaceae bacterium]
MIDTVDPKTPKKLRILIVEDEPDAREASLLYLQYLGYDAVGAERASTALALAQDKTPDLVICDWRIEGNRDGVELGRELQSRYGARLIFVTAYPMYQLREATSDLEVERYISKPISLTDLAAAVKSVSD